MSSSLIIFLLMRNKLFFDANQNKNNNGYELKESEQLINIKLNLITLMMIFIKSTYSPLNFHRF